MEATNNHNPAAGNSSSSSSPPPRRSICPNCSRPQPVCLCKFLPSSPIATKTKIILLQHPHEAQHKLSTTPILTKCLLNATTIVNRRLKPGLSELLDRSPPAVFLFPPTPHSTPPINISELNITANLVLIAFDGTWKHAKEMVRSSEEFLSRFARRVCLDFDESVEGGSIFDSELILRKEPHGGCVSTMEAVARCLRVMEPDGAAIEKKLIEVLREMVRLQAGFLKPMNPRPKLLKIKNRKKKMSEGEDEN
ncbi:tRNA-uridine aminocarboxypropyltransferase 2 [Benincasa hispida]|uniref:tRNA-uridine aminocarboxypropyltransferase 2 n=1 Tax=Benincasa hispida TaxID=102211 RepID=UPI001900BFC2|nr:tRNA-uridine aminocarboxypropyltransferase 2 [Benincasa hispida]